MSQTKISEHTLLKKIEVGRPVDYSFKNLRNLKSFPIEGTRTSRAGSPERNPATRKFLSRTLWLNNNKLKNVQNLNELINLVFDKPELVGWLDFSFNFITTLDSSITKWPNLKILYFHGNCISDLEEIYKLKNLKQLRSVTFHGNPVSNLPIYRSYIIALFPQLMNLDFTPVLPTERSQPPPGDLTKRLKEDEMKNKK